jgi:hypothetical protein
MDKLHSTCTAPHRVIHERGHGRLVAHQPVHPRLAAAVRGVGAVQVDPFESKGLKLTFHIIGSRGSRVSNQAPFTVWRVETRRLSSYRGLKPGAFQAMEGWNQAPFKPMGQLDSKLVQPPTFAALRLQYSAVKYALV